LAGVSSGGATALLFVEFAKKMGLDISSLRSIFVSAAALDFNDSIALRGEPLSEFYRGYLDVDSESSIAIRKPNVLKLADEYNNLKIIMAQGTADAQVPDITFRRLMAEVEAARRINSSVYANLELDLIQGGQHNITDLDLVESYLARMVR